MKLPNISPHIFSEAVWFFWETRRLQAQKQKERGAVDHGARSAVTGGKQMDGFIYCIRNLLLESGLPKESIYYGNRLTDLPGFFRPTKQWDLVIVHNNKLIAAIELKSQVGSFGNNFNNRIEEALGTALDTWTAYRKGVFGATPVPWLGYLLLLEDSKGSRRKVRVNEPHFKVLEEFRNTSYLERYILFCRKILLERHYSGACLLIANESYKDETPNYLEPDKDLAPQIFLKSLLCHVLAQLS